MRMIEQFGEFMLSLKKLIEDEQYEKGIEYADKTLAKITGLENKTLSMIDVDNFIDIMKLRREMYWVDLIFAAKVLKEKGDLYLLLDKKEEADIVYIYTMKIWLYLINEIDEFEFEKYDTEIGYIYEKVKDFEFSTPYKMQFINYFLNASKYDLGENFIFELLEDDNVGDQDKNVVYEKALKFYDTLLTKDDDDLIFGGLPREEAIEGYDDLKGYS